MDNQYSLYQSLKRQYFRLPIDKRLHTEPMTLNMKCKALIDPFTLAQTSELPKQQDDKNPLDLLLMNKKIKSQLPQLPQDNIEGAIGLRKIIENSQKQFETEYNLPKIMIPGLLKCIQKKNHPQIQFQALWCLNTIITVIDTLMCQSEVIQKVIPQLSEFVSNQTSHKILKEVLWIIGNLSIERKQYREKFIQLNIRKKIMEINYYQGKYRQIFDLKIQACWALSTLCSGDEKQNFNKDSEYEASIAYLTQWLNKYYYQKGYKQIISEKSYDNVFDNCLWALCEFCDLKQKQQCQLFIKYLQRVLKYSDAKQFSISRPILRMLFFLSSINNQIVNEFWKKQAFYFIYINLQNYNLEQRSEFFQLAFNLHLYTVPILKKDKSKIQWPRISDLIELTFVVNESEQDTIFLLIETIVREDKNVYIPQNLPKFIKMTNKILANNDDRFEGTLKVMVYCMECLRRQAFKINQETDSESRQRRLLFVMLQTVGQYTLSKLKTMRHGNLLKQSRMADYMLKISELKGQEFDIVTCIKLKKLYLQLD